MENNYDNLVKRNQRKQSLEEEEIDLENNFNENSIISSEYFKDSVVQTETLKKVEDKTPRMDLNQNDENIFDIYFIVQNQKIKQNKKRVLSYCPVIKKIFFSQVLTLNNNTQKKEELIKNLPNEVTFPSLCMFYDIAEKKEVDYKKLDIDKILQILILSLY
ncbi:MAG: hypothetical protein MJ252_10380, partial [archaeon]|nr:hypothetical protein [archaeon]